jgi:hypothetical protein
MGTYRPSRGPQKVATLLAKYCLAAALHKRRKTTLSCEQFFFCPPSASGSLHASHTTSSCHLYTLSFPHTPHSLTSFPLFTPVLRTPQVPCNSGQILSAVLRNSLSKSPVKLILADSQSNVSLRSTKYCVVITQLIICVLLHPAAVFN